MEKILWLIVLLGVSFTCCIQITENFKNTWHQFKHNYSKSYLSFEEEEYRKNIFLKNIGMIEQHNKLYNMKYQSYKMGINEFTDLNFDEFAIKMLNTVEIKQKPGDENCRNIHKDSRDGKEIDWRQSGVVTPVRNQNGCAASYAFSATSTLESAFALKYGVANLTEFSKQQLIDCDPYNFGCRGGSISNTFEYLHNVGGIATEECYPFDGEQLKQCRLNSSKIEMEIKYDRVGNKDDMYHRVGEHGPIVGLFSVTDQYRHYESGIFTQDRRECGRVANYHVVIVGYKENEYWIVKNSWGTSFGENGYARIGPETCGINEAAFYPII